MARSNFGPLLDYPLFKEFLKIVAKRREEAVVECCTTKPGDSERIARAQERISESDWILSESWTQGDNNE